MINHRNITRLITALGAAIVGVLAVHGALHLGNGGRGKLGCSHHSQVTPAEK